MEYRTYPYGNSQIDSPGSQPGGLGARAAFRALARGGVEAIAVEPIAAELGTTKGSFYWHFKNRDSLVRGGA